MVKAGKARQAFDASVVEVAHPAAQRAGASPAENEVPGPDALDVPVHDRVQTQGVRLTLATDAVHQVPCAHPGQATRPAGAHGGGGGGGGAVLDARHGVGGGRGGGRQARYLGCLSATCWTGCWSAG